MQKYLALPAEVHLEQTGKIIRAEIALRHFCEEFHLVRQSVMLGHTPAIREYVLIFGSAAFRVGPFLA
jgi:hypothetical protein